MKALFTSKTRWAGLAIFALAALQVSAQNNCSSPVVIPSIPFSSGAQTTCGTVNDFAAGFASCVSSFYGGGEDYVYSITITGAPVTYTLSLGGAATWKIASVHSACPPTGTNCIGGIITGSGSSASGNVTFPANGTYFIIVDTWPSPACGAFTLDIALASPPPANDNCSGAIAFPTIPMDGSCATVTVSTVSATGTADPVCTGTEDDDVWYTFTTPPGATSVLYSNTNISGSGDRVLQVYSGGSCGMLTSIGCYDPESGTITGLSPSTTYFLRVYTWGSGVSTTFSLCLSVAPPPPANDNCAGAVTLTPGVSCTTTAGTTVGATQTIPAITCNTFTASTALDVWYQFTATSSSHNVIVSGSGTFDAVVDVRSGACNGTNIACADATFAGGTETVALTGLTVGVTYLVRVYSFSGTGAFNICVTTPAPPCSTPGPPSASGVTPTSATLSWTPAAGATLYRYSFGSGTHTCGTGSLTTTSTSVNLSGLIPNTTYTFCVRTDACSGGGPASGYVTTTFTTPPLPNDLCTGAIAVSCNSTVTGSTVGATSDASLGFCGVGSGGTPGNGIWYKIAGDGSLVTLNLCASAYDTKVHVYSGTCSSLTCVASNDDFCSTQSQVSFVTSTGVDYFILVSGFSSSTGAFSMSITCVCGTALGAPWTVSSIGGATGSATDNVCGGSIDIGSNGFSPSLTSDMLMFAHQNLCGNQTITVRVNNITNSGFAGIMFRENTAAGSRLVALKTQLGNFATRDLRNTTNGMLNSQQFPAFGHRWLRLVRNGSTFIGFVSPNGVNWQQVMVVTLALPSCVEVGLFTQGLNVNSTATAVFSNVSIVPSPLVAPVVVDGERPFDTPLEFSLFPNPAQNDLNVKLSEAFLGKQLTLQVSNQLGQTVMVRKIAAVENLIETIPVNQLPHGVYIMTLRAEDSQSLTKKFIVGVGQRP